MENLGFPLLLIFSLDYLFYHVDSGFISQTISNDDDPRDLTISTYDPDDDDDQGEMIGTVGDGGYGGGGGFGGGYGGGRGFGGGDLGESNFGVQKQGYGGFQEEGGFQDGGYQEGGFYEGGRQEGGFQEGGFQEGGFQEGGFQEGGFQKGGYQEEGLQEGGFQEGRIQDGGYLQEGRFPDGGYPKPGFYGGGRPKRPSIPSIPSGALQQASIITNSPDGGDTSISQIMVNNHDYGENPEENFPPVACPAIFKYMHDPNLGGYFGYISIPRPKGEIKYDTEVNMTINRPVSQQDNIKLQLMSTANDIYYGDTLHWAVKFPYQDLLPKLTQIRFNKVVVCSNYPDPLIPGVTQSSMWAKSSISSGKKEDDDDLAKMKKKNKKKKKKKKKKKRRAKDRRKVPFGAPSTSYTQSFDPYPGEVSNYQQSFGDLPGAPIDAYRNINSWR